MPNRERPAESLSTDIHLLGDLLGQVIRSQGGIELFELEERIRALAKARRSDRQPGDRSRALRTPGSPHPGPGRRRRPGLHLLF